MCRRESVRESGVPALRNARHRCDRDRRGRRHGNLQRLHVVISGFDMHVFKMMVMSNQNMNKNIKDQIKRNGKFYLENEIFIFKI